MTTGILGTDGAALAAFVLGSLPSESGDPLNAFIEQHLGWTDEVSWENILNVEFNQVWFGQTVVGLYGRFAQQMLSKALSSAWYADANVSFIDYLNFTERKFFDTGNLWGLTDRWTIAVEENVANYWFTNPTDQNYWKRAYNAENVIGFTDDVEYATAGPIKNEFDFEETVDSVGPQERDVSGGFLKQSISFSVADNSCKELEYAPKIGETEDDTFNTFNPTPPTLTTGTLALTHPRIGPTLTLTLGNPDFGNVDVLHFTKIDRVTRGGDRKIFSDPTWANWERLTLKITGICDEDFDSILAFLNQSLGDEIGLTDWEGRSWKGVIVAPETDVRSDVSGFTLDLTFEGVLI